MQKYYEDAKYNAAFERCVDVMVRLIEKYGHQVLEKLQQNTPQTAKCPANDTQAKPPSMAAA